MENMLSTWKEVFEDRAEQERLLRWKHPGYDFIYNWLVAAVMLAVILGLIVWGIQVGLERRDERNMETGRQEIIARQLEAEQSAAAEAERQAQALEAKRAAYIDIVARAIYGIRNFIEKYHYSEADIETYIWSAYNRAVARGMDLAEVFAEEGQYIAYSSSNTILPEYREMAERIVDKLMSGEHPCDTAYQYAELIPQGIFLFITENGRRWHA